MQHPDEGTIHAWLDGALSADEAAQLEAHVKDCPQCQAAVAEARGFIAASSRILTALDNAPRGVIPAAAPRKRVEPWVWRVAATVLVVATGTFVVLRERGTTESRETVATDSAPLVQTKPAADGPVAENAPVTRPSVTQQNAPLAAIPSPYQQNATAGGIAAGPMAAAAPSRAPMLSRKTAAPRGTEEQELSAGNAQPGARLGGQQGAVAEMGKASTVPPAPASVPTRALSEQTYSALSAANTVTPRQVDQKRMIGGTQTFYELAPGDTVVLEEKSNAQLQSVVVTGAAAGAARRADRRAQPQTMPATDKAAAAPEAAQKTVTPAPPPSSALLDAASLDVHSISWLDRSSGRVLILSGRHTQEELEQIRKRIEQVRAAEQSKKNPE